MKGRKRVLDVVDPPAVARDEIAEARRQHTREWVGHELGQTRPQEDPADAGDDGCQECRTADPKLAWTFWQVGRLMVGGDGRGGGAISHRWSVAPWQGNATGTG